MKKNETQQKKQKQNTYTQKVEVSLEMYIAIFKGV